MYILVFVGSLLPYSRTSQLQDQVADRSHSPGMRRQRVKRSRVAQTPSKLLGISTGQQRCMQDLSCSQTDRFLARTCLGSVSSCVFRCLFDVSARTTLKSIHLTSSNRQPIVVEQILLGNLLEANVPKNQRQHEYVCTETHTS